MSIKTLIFGTDSKPHFYPWPGGMHMMGRFSVPAWFYDLCPTWMHHAADWCGGVEPSPWRELRDRLRSDR